MKKCLLFVLLSLPTATSHAASYFYQVNDVFGARGYVVGAVEISDGRSGIILDVGGGVQKVLPCTTTVLRFRQNQSTQGWNTVNLPACGLELTEPCASRNLEAGDVGPETYSGAECAGGSHGYCVNVSGHLDTAAFLAEEPYERPVVELTFERSNSLCTN